MRKLTVVSVREKTTLRAAFMMPVNGWSAVGKAPAHGLVSGAAHDVRVRALVDADLLVHPYVAGEGTRLFDDDPKSYRLDLVSSTEFSNGTVGLHYRWHR